jgi:predicted Holliday junction resolvase-like endonuclease
MEAENAQLHPELATAKSSAEQIKTANKLATEAWQKAEDLESELTQVKAKLETEQKLKEEAQSLAEKREDRLCKSGESLLGKPLRHFISCSFPWVFMSYCLYSRFAQVLPILLWIARISFGLIP